MCLWGHRHSLLEQRLVGGLVPALAALKESALVNNGAIVLHTAAVYHHPHRTPAANLDRGEYCTLRPLLVMSQHVAVPARDRDRDRGRGRRAGLILHPGCHCHCHCHCREGQTRTARCKTTGSMAQQANLHTADVKQPAAPIASSPNPTRTTGGDRTRCEGRAPYPPFAAKCRPFPCASASTLPPSCLTAYQNIAIIHILPLNRQAPG